jgi:hypothetical protein
VAVSKKQEPKMAPMSELSKMLSTDKQLNEDPARYQLFLSLANFLDSDLKDNLNKTSFELDEKYSTYNAHAWLQFKQHPIVRKYITQYLDEEQLAQARKTISQEGIAKTRDAINVQEVIEGKQKVDQNTNIIVFYMPQKNYTKVD